MWLKRSTTHERLKLNTPEQMQALNAIWALIDFDSTAPDDLWLPLLRKNGQLRLWASNNEITRTSEFHQKLTTWEAKLQKIRQKFAFGLSEIRRLNISNHYWLPT